MGITTSYFYTKKNTVRLIVQELEEGDVVVSAVTNDKQQNAIPLKVSVAYRDKLANKRKTFKNVTEINVRY